MMINFSAYFYSGSVYTSTEFLILYSLFIWILVIINFTILVKVFLSKNANEISKSLLVKTLVWLNIWLVGEILLTSFQLFSNRTVYVMNGIDNIFIPFGLVLSILYFSRYLQTQLMINKYSKRMNTISGQIISVAFYAGFLALLLVLGRFLLLPFFSGQGLNEVDTIIIVISMILAIFVLILFILALFQLRHEINFISSKFEQARIKMYQYFILSLLLSLIFIILNLVFSIITIPQEFGQLLAIPLYLGATTGLLSLFVAYTMPKWYRKRMGLVISFGE